MKRARPVFVSPAAQRPFKKPRQAPPRKQAVTIGAEKKFHDASASDDATTTTTIVNLNNMAAGDTALLRDGNKIICKSVQIRMSLRAESSTVSNIVRVLVIYDKNANGVAPTAAQVFQGTPSVTAMKNISNASRFVTLMDKIIPIHSRGSFDMEYLNEFIRIPTNLQLSQFSDGSAAVPISGSLTLLYLGNEAAGTNDVDVVLATRTRFIG